MRVELGEGLEPFLLFTVVDEPLPIALVMCIPVKTGQAYSGTLWEQHDQKRQQTSRDDLNTETDSPLPRVVWTEAGVAAKRSPTCDQSTDSQHELLQGSDSTTNTWMSKLCLVQRNDHYEETDTVSIVREVGSY